MCQNIEHNPGKFEGESCITKLAYHWMLNGFADEHGDTEEGTPDVFMGPFTAEDITNVEDIHVCSECDVQIMNASRIELYESSNGFVTTKIS